MKNSVLLKWIVFLIIFIAGVVLGWEARYYRITDACLDGGGQVVRQNHILTCHL